MPVSFDLFMTQLKETNVSLADYVDFPKVSANVQNIAIKLHQLNYLVGQQDMNVAVRELWKENPASFSVLDILIAVRTKDRKKAITENGETKFINDCFSSPEDVIAFLDETGLTKILQEKQIKNLVDYVFGIEVGLDSNARKNRSGHIMENIIETQFENNGLIFHKEVYCTEFPEIEKALGTDKKRFDFVVKTRKKTYLIEVNFYSGGGSKLNEVARSYMELAPKINAVPDYEFVWITDGVGWKSASNKLKEAYTNIPEIYNLTTLHSLISKFKAEQQWQ